MAGVFPACKLNGTLPIDLTVRLYLSHLFRIAGHGDYGAYAGCTTCGITTAFHHVVSFDKLGVLRKEVILRNLHFAWVIARRRRIARIGKKESKAAAA
jgi:hypothetical protein